MKQTKKHHLNVIPNTTCWATHEKFNVNCQRQSCKNWIPFAEQQNCVLIAANNGSHTLQTIGQIYGLSRMRICQIEKGIYEKLASIISS